MLGFRSASSLALPLLLAACSGAPGTSSGLSQDSNVELRVAIVNSCPRSRGVSRDESFGAGVAAALIPALIDTSFAAVGSALQKAAMDDVDTKSSKTVGRFYSAVRKTDKERESFEIRKNIENACIVIAHGPVADGNTVTKFEDRQFYDTAVRSVLSNSFGMKSDPWFYYEGRFVYAVDGTAFRIDTEAVRYARNLKNGGKGKRGLAVSIIFALPGGTNNGTSFATATIPLGNLEAPTTRRGTPELGTSNAAIFSTPWLPMPAVNANIKTNLTNARLRVANRKTNISKIKQAYKTVAPNAEVPLENAQSEEEINKLIDQSAIATNLSNLTQQIGQLSAQIAEQRANLDGTFVNLTKALLKERAGLEGAMEIERQIEVNRKLLDFKTAVVKNEEKLRQLIDAKMNVESLKTAGRDLNSLNLLLKRDSDELAQFQPFNLNVEVTEKKESSAVLKFFADVFTAAQPGLVAAVKAEIDPKTRKELEDQERKDEEKRQDDFNKIHQDAVVATLTVQGAEIDIDLLKSDASASDRHAKEVALRTAKLDATAKCQKAARIGAQPTECSQFL